MPAVTSQPLQSAMLPKDSSVFPASSSPLQAKDPSPGHRLSLASEMFKKLHRDTDHRDLKKETIPTAHKKSEPKKKRLSKVLVEVHTPPSVVGRSRRPSPSLPATPRSVSQDDFDLITEAPLPSQPSPQAPYSRQHSKDSEFDPVEVLRSQDPEIIRQQQLIWNEAKKRSEVVAQLESSPPLPLEPYPENPSPPRLPAPSSSPFKRPHASSCKFKYWPDKLPPPSTVPNLPGLYRAGEVSNRLYMWGLRFRTPEECLKSLGLPLDVVEESPPKRRKTESDPPSRSASCSGYSDAPRSHHPPFPVGRGDSAVSAKDLLETLIGPEVSPPPPPPKDQAEEAPPLSKESVSTLIKFKPIQDALKKHFPEANFPPLRQPRPSMGFEETLRSGNKEEVMAAAESSLLPTYDRLQKIKEALDKKIRDTTDRGQGALAHLRTCRPLYFVHDDPYFTSSAPLNEDFKKLVPFPRASKTMVSMPMEELIKMERTLQGLQATQSFSSWLLDGLAKEICRTDFEPVDPVLFNGIHKFLGGPPWSRV